MSSINSCPHCGRSVSIPQYLFGCLVRCPMCGQQFQVGGAPPVVPTGPTYVPVHVEPHRGGTILVLGILSLVICGLLGPIAWIMGSIDLAKVRRGEMDNSGYGITQAGWILGIIGTILSAVMFFVLLIIAII